MVPYRKIVQELRTLLKALASDGSEHLLTQLTDGTFTYQHARSSVNLEIENLAASQDYILVDVSDTDRFPHASAGVVYLTLVDIFINPDSTFVGDIEIGFLDNVDENNGDVHPFHTWHLDKRAENIVEVHSVPFDPLIASPETHLSSAIGLNDVGFQNDVPLGSPLDNVTAYTTLPGSGDIYLRVVMTAGTVDISLMLKYYTV